MDDYRMKIIFLLKRLTQIHVPWLPSGYVLFF